MFKYESKDSLKNAILKSYKKYISEFSDVPEELKDKRCKDAECSPAENLAFQVGWTTLQLKWEADERKGLRVKTPSEKFKWNQLQELYQWFYESYAGLSLQELKCRLDRNVDDILDMIDTMSEEEIFLRHQRKWANGASRSIVWEVAKFIYVNTISSFDRFGTQIRTWKEEYLGTPSDRRSMDEGT